MKKLLYIIVALFAISTVSANENVRSKSGYASYYSVRSNGGTRTASGIPLKDTALTAASCIYPLGSTVRVTNSKTGKSVVVKITDRGPFATHNGRVIRPLRPHPHRIVDLTIGAAKQIYKLDTGIIHVKTTRIK